VTVNPHCFDGGHTVQNIRRLMIRASPLLLQPSPFRRFVADIVEPALTIPQMVMKTLRRIIGLASWALSSRLALVVFVDISELRFLLTPGAGKESISVQGLGDSVNMDGLILPAHPSGRI